MNERIFAREVRVIDPEGKQLGIMPRDKALERAREYGLDLVVVSFKSSPPVCRIMDYGKFKYLQSKKIHEIRKKQAIGQIKEVKFRLKTDEHDFNTKIRHIARFLEKKNKVRVSVNFRGREIAHSELGVKMLDRIAEAIKEIGTVEHRSALEGRSMTMMVVPKAPSPQ